MIAIRAEATPGMSIENAAREVCALADRIEAKVYLKFNDVECIAYPGGDAEKLVAGWLTAVREQSPPKMAFNR